MNDQPQILIPKIRVSKYMIYNTLAAETKPKMTKKAI